jgi:hypothetical protein
MFPKLLLAILALIVTAAAHLGLRQRRLELAHEAAAIHRRISDHERACWAIQARIAERCGVERVREAMTASADVWLPYQRAAEPPAALAAAGSAAVAPR